MKTKEQEREALEKIRKIVEDLGSSSYLAMTFEGCFDLAEENIENDFGCSWKQRAEKAAGDAEYFRRLAQRFSDEADKADALREELKELRKQIPKLDDITDCIQLCSEVVYDTDRRKEEYAKKIVEYADNPDSEDFKDAVKAHRGVCDKNVYYARLAARLNSLYRGDDE